MGMTPDKLDPPLFNTPLEAGVRAVVLLEAFAERSFDIKTLALLDYYVVHTADVGGPESVHPDLEARTGEYFVRRSLVEAGILLMVRAGLVERMAGTEGITFRSKQTAAAMIDMMASGYNQRLHESAKWLSGQAADEGLAAFFETLQSGVEGRVHELVGGPL